METQIKKPVVLVVFPLADWERELLGRTYYVNSWCADGRADAATLRDARAVIVSGSAGLKGLDLDACPSLGLVHCLGGGHEGMDLGVLAERGIRISTAGGVHSGIVADHAIGLWLASLRSVVVLDREVRDGKWKSSAGPARTSGRRMGMLGFGTIGQAIVRRLGGFDVEIGYHARQRVSGSKFVYFSDAHALAGWANDVIVTLPGGPATRHMVDAEFLRALGPEGHFVNVGRGSVVKTQAMIDALNSENIAGAALDVVEEEPNIPDALRNHPRAIITPHVAGHSPHTRKLLWERALLNLDAFFRDGIPATPAKVRS